MTKQNTHDRGLRMLPALLGSLLLPGLAAPAEAQVTYLGPAPEIAETAPADPNARRALTFGLDSSWSQNWILGAAHAAGRFGSFYRTNLYLMAPCAGTNGNVVFAVYSLPNGSSNGGQTGLLYTIPAGGFGVIVDVVNEFGQNGGATIYLKVDGARSTVTSSCQELSSWAQTYTLAENGGEYSTGLLSTFGNTISSSKYGAITGVEQNDRKRTIVVVFNPYSGSGVVRLFVFDEKGSPIGQKDVTVYPYSATQVSLDGFRIGSPGGSIRAATVTSYFYFEAAAVTVDNLTNDGFFRHFTEHDL